MIITVKNEVPFQILSSSFSIGPSQTGYELQVGADSRSFSTLFSVGANTPRMVTNVANGSYFRLKNNVGDVKVNWQRVCVDEGSGSGTELTPVAEFPLGAAEGTVVALASGDTVGLYQFIDGEWVLVGADDPTKLIAVNELPASAETGTVMALYKEGEAGGGTWKLSQDGSYYYFDCDFSTLDQTQEYPLGLPFDMYQPIRIWDGDFILYYNNGWRIKNGYEDEDDFGKMVHYDVDFQLSPSASAIYGGDWECETATGDPDNPYIRASFEWNNVTEQLEVRSNGHNFNDPGMCQPDLKNIAGEAGEPILGLYQYDGQNWNEVGGDVDLSAYWTSGETQEKLEDMQLPIAAAVNELKDNFEARLDQQYYKKAEVNDIAARKVEAGQVNVQIKDYVDPAIAEVNDTIEDKELPVSAALNKLNDDIATIDEVIPAAIVDINDRMVSSSTVKTIWRGSQNEYDAITVKDAATLYIII